MKKIELKAENLKGLHVEIQDVMLEGESVVRVVKSDRLHDYDINSYAKVLGASFHNGTIMLDVRSRLIPEIEGPKGGYIGLAFRTNENDSEFECFYVRPAAGRSNPNPDSRKVGCQYFSFPGYTFSYFREFGIEGYETSCDIDLDEWITIKAIIHDDTGEFYVNDMEHPVMVQQLKHGINTTGGIGLFVDIAAECFFKNLRIMNEEL